MKFDDIDELIAERQENIDKPSSQIRYGVIFLITAFFLAMLLFKDYYVYSISLVTGVFIGITLRYSRFCFASAFREPFVTGNTGVMRAVILGLIVSTIGFAWIKLDKIPVVDTNIASVDMMIPSGINVIVGGLIFGIGMVIAGGCVTGMLMRIGEGHGVFLLVGIGFIIGSFLGGSKDKVKTLYFLDYFNIKKITVLQIIALLLMYGLAVIYERIKKEV